MGKEQRSVLNYVKSANLNKTYYMHVFAGGVAFLGILMAYASRLLAQVNEIASTIPDSYVAATMQNNLYVIAMIFFFSFLSFLCCTVFYMVVLSQRVGGPSIAIVAVIKDLQKGNYDVKRELRKDDELGAIMSELKVLANILREKKA